MAKEYNRIYQSSRPHWGAKDKPLTAGCTNLIWTQSEVWNVAWSHHFNARIELKPGWCNWLLVIHAIYNPFDTHDWLKNITEYMRPAGCWTKGHSLCSILLQQRLHKHQHVLWVVGSSVSFTLMHESQKYFLKNLSVLFNIIFV